MKKKFRLKIVFWGLMCLLMTGITSHSLTVLADEQTATVNTQYSLLDRLSEAEQATIIKAKPQVTLTNQTENFTLVYRLSQIPPQSATVNTLPTAAAPITHQVSKGTLPQTGDMGMNPYLIGLGALLLVGVISLAIWRRKAWHHLLLIMVISGGAIFNARTVDAASNDLPHATTSQMPKGTVYGPDVAVAGFEYVGYMHTVDNPVVVTTGHVTVNYQDEKGNAIAEATTLTGNIGESYTAEQKEISGYTFKAVSGQVSGTFSKDNQTITYVYSQTGLITLKQSGFISLTDKDDKTPSYYVATYYDMNGEVLKTEKIESDITLNDVTLTVPIGQSYKVYERVTYERYSVATDKPLYWGDYILYTEEPGLTEGVMNQPTLTIHYILSEFGYA